MKEVTFAGKHPDAHGSCKDPEDQRTAIEEFLKTTKWIDPRFFVSRRGEPDSVEAVIVLEHLPGIRHSGFRSWLQKKLPNMFDGSLCSFDSACHWSAYSFHSVEELNLPEVADAVKEFSLRGYRILIRQLEAASPHRLHGYHRRRLMWFSSSSFDEFMRMHFPMSERLSC